MRRRIRRWRWHMEPELRTVDNALQTAIDLFNQEQGWMYSTPFAARDRCLSAAHGFMEYCADQAVTAKLVSGLWVDPDNIVLHGHYVVRIGDNIYDWSARQFYPAAPMPLIIPFTEWAAQWRVTQGEQ